MTNKDRQIDPGHQTPRAALRIVGPILVGVGLLLIAVGVGSFFSSFGGFEPPRFFWCAFLGMPILFAGTVCCKFGFMGRVSRYVAGEVAPVQKDTFNYLAEGTQQGLRTLAGAVRDGFSQGETSVAKCSKCHAANEADAKFCAHCGAELPRERSCPACSAANAADAQFCNQCGGALPG